MPPGVTHGCGGGCADDGRECGAAATSIGPGAGAGLTRGRAAKADSAAGWRGPGNGAVSSPGDVGPAGAIRVAASFCSGAADRAAGGRASPAALLATVTPASLSLTNRAACGPARTGASGGAGRAARALRRRGHAIRIRRGPGRRRRRTWPGPRGRGQGDRARRCSRPAGRRRPGCGPGRPRRGRGACRERDRGPCVDDRRPRRAGVGQHLRAALQQLGQRQPADHATVPFEDGVALPGAGESRPLGAPVQPGQQLGVQGPGSGLIRWRHSAGCHRARLPGDRAGDALREPARLTQERRGEPLVD